MNVELHRGGVARSKVAPWNDSTAAPLIRFEGVTKAFGDFAAVDELSLSIYDGEFFALLGPSGCGKTTLLRLLAGFEMPDRGTVMLAGTDLAGVPPYRRPVNMMFQNYALFPHLNVAQNIAFGLKQDSLPRSEIADRVRELLTLVKLEGFEARRPGQLSGGQRQRVALARALARRPKVLLLDEPLAALDRKLRRETKFELMELQRRLGTTFVIVTHDQEEAMTVADRMAVMDRGRLVQVATPVELYEQPSSRWVAEFLGEINLVEGRVAANERNTVIVEAAGGMRLRAASPASALAAGQTIWIGIRPERLSLSRIPVDVPEVNCVAAEVREIAYIGDALIYKTRLGNGLDMQVKAANAFRHREAPLDVGERIWMTWPPDAGITMTE